MEQQELIPHLFRTEFRKITAVLCKLFGIEHIEIAEDIASETFLSALETWTFKGIPENPTAWLYSVAKNKAKNYINRNHIFTEKIAGQIKYSSPEMRKLKLICLTKILLIANYKCYLPFATHPFQPKHK